MNDKRFLLWIHDRMISEHKENPNADYMHKLRAIIANTDKSQETPNTASFSPQVLSREALDIVKGMAVSCLDSESAMGIDEGFDYSDGSDSGKKRPFRVEIEKWVGYKDF